MQPGRRYDEHQVVRISVRSAVVAVMVVVLVLVGQRIFVAAHRPLSWAAAAIVVAVLIDPLVSVLGRRIPRVLAVLGALVVAGGLAFFVIYRAFDDLSAGVDQLGEAAQDAAAQLEERDDNVGDLARDVEASRRVEDFVDTLEERATGGEDVLVSTAGTAPTYFIGAIFTIFFLSYGPRLAHAALEQIPDERGRRRLALVVRRALVRARRAALLTVAEALLVGLAVGLAAGAMGIPAPSALGLTAGLLAILPHVGFVLGALPFLLLVLGLRSDLAAIALAVIVVVAQLVDSLVVRRLIADRSVHIGLLVPWGVVLLGYAVYGVGGAAYGLAFAVFGLAVVDEMGRIQPTPEPEPGEAEPEPVEAAATPGPEPVEAAAMPEPEPVEPELEPVESAEGVAPPPPTPATSVAAGREGTAADEDALAPQPTDPVVTPEAP